MLYGLDGTAWAGPLSCPRGLYRSRALPFRERTHRRVLIYYSVGTQPQKVALLRLSPLFLRPSEWRLFGAAAWEVAVAPTHRNHWKPTGNACFSSSWMATPTETIDKRSGNTCFSSSCMAPPTETKPCASRGGTQKKLPSYPYSFLYVLISWSIT